LLRDPRGAALVKQEALRYESPRLIGALILFLLILSESDELRPESAHRGLEEGW
jgi:hypothetical protein